MLHACKDSIRGGRAIDSAGLISSPREKGKGTPRFVPSHLSMRNQTPPRAPTVKHDPKFKKRGKKTKKGGRGRKDLEVVSREDLTLCPGVVPTRFPPQGLPPPLKGPGGKRKKPKNFGFFLPKSRFFVALKGGKNTRCGYFHLLPPTETTGENYYKKGPQTPLSFFPNSPPSQGSPVFPTPTPFPRPPGVLTGLTPPKGPLPHAFSPQLAPLSFPPQTPGPGETPFPLPPLSACRPRFPKTPFGDSPPVQNHPPHSTRMSHSTCKNLSKNFNVCLLFL